MAPVYAPDPVDAVLAVWRDDPLNPDQATEQIRMLAAAVEREGDDATSLRALVGTPSGG